jgi:sugar fermentation stimulation protein A
MRFFHHIRRATFLSRPNRFLVRCRLGNQRVDAFLPNPGRLQELLLPGAMVHLVGGKREGGRKTLYTLVAVEREGRPILLHTHRTNDVARFLLERGVVPGLKRARIVKAEVQVVGSRFDFLLEEDGRRVFLEVKSCTLVGRRVAMFPDAITERGARHLRELADLARHGTRTAVLFVVHWPLAEVFMPDYHTDLDFAKTLQDARRDVEVIPLAVSWGRDLSLAPEARLLDIPWSYIQQEAEDRGSYLLILKVGENVTLRVGSLGRAEFRKGFYVYAGSAMANLSQRMARHRRLIKKHRWHIDELRAVSEFRCALAIRSATRLECRIAEALSKMADGSIHGFGCSDCNCGTHLFWMKDDPLQSAAFQKVLQYFRMDRYEESAHV